MAIQVIHLRDYEISISSDFVASIRVYNDWSKTSYAALPTIAEIKRELGETVSEIDLTYCFSGCESLATAPAIPNGVTNMFGCFRGCINLTTAPTIPSGVTNMRDCFQQCKSLTTAPTIPSGVTNMNGCFRWCINLTTAPTIPNTVTDMRNCFQQCEPLTTAPTIPSSVTAMDYCFSSCSSLTGKITINANPSSYEKCMAGTQKEIVLTGSSAQLQNIANTATNNNVYVWSLSINLSAERQEDDGSKANVSVIINRFRNNNESVSLTFTMNGVESTPVQVMMDTATKTYNVVLSIAPASIVELSVIAEDSYGKSAPKSITIPIPFYTIDFKAGGMEVAVGAPANDNLASHPNGLFKCAMDALFGGSAEFDGSLTLGTALSIADGGTGAKTAAGARSNLGINASNLGIKDYVVEQGTSGDWKYRKWNSGIAECFGYISLGSISVSAVGNVYRGDKSVSLPAIFNDIPSNVHITNGDPLVHIISINGRATDANTVSAYVWKATSSTVTVYGAFHVIGTWK